MQRFFGTIFFAAGDIEEKVPLPVAVVVIFFAEKESVANVGFFPDKCGLVIECGSDGVELFLICPVGNIEFEVDLFGDGFGFRKNFFEFYEKNKSR